MIPDVSGARALAHVREICERFGSRPAGSEKERKAAEHIAARFREFGLSEVVIEPFPCLTWDYSRASLTVAGAEIPCLPVAHSPATPAGGIEAELVYLERASDIDLARVPLAGKIGLLSTLYGDDSERLRRLMDSGLAAVILVDDRLPFDWTVAVGVPAQWIRLLSIPMVSIPYRHAWEIVRNGAQRARLEVATRVREAESQNVVGVVPGSDPTAGDILLTCHHDTVMNAVGAEDNGSGVACVLELARAFAGSRPRRTLRFVACGCEEQLSEGSKEYVLRHRDEMPGAQFVLNTDSVGGWMGQNEVIVSGCPEMYRWLEGAQQATGFSAKLLDQVSPYSDHFPFTAVGVPGIWVHRTNCAGGRFFHHSALDTPDVLSPGVLDATLRFQARLLNDLAHAEELPFPRAVPDAQREVIARFWRDLYGVADQGDGAAPIR